MTDLAATRRKNTKGRGSYEEQHYSDDESVIVKNKINKYEKKKRGRNTSYHITDSFRWVSIILIMSEIQVLGIAKPDTTSDQASQGT